MKRARLAFAFAVLAGAIAAPHAGQGTKIPAKPGVTEVATDHLRIRYANELAPSPDGSIALTVEIAPRPTMHVYAPGAEDYQVITLTLSEQAGIRPRPVSYPPSEIYHFEPLNERIPVYQKPFKLTLDAHIKNAGRAGDLKTRGIRISGRLDYQACDDKVCFAPVSVPLSWTVFQ